MENNDLFHELRDMLGGEWSSISQLQKLLEQGYAQDPEVYNAQWLPLLAKAPLPPFTARTQEQLLSLAQLLPNEVPLYATFEDVSDHLPMLEVLESPIVHRLTELSVTHAGPEGLEAILAHPGMTSVRGLRLGGAADDDWGPEAIELLANADTLKGLRSLSFINTGSFSDEHCMTLAHAPNLGQLEALGFLLPSWDSGPCDAVSDIGVNALIAAMPDLVYLNLQACSSVTGAVLEQAANLRGLRGLGINGVAKPSAALSSLLQQLTHLDLSQSRLSGKHRMPFEVLVATLTQRPTRLRYLQLARYPFDSTTIAKLAASEAFPELVHLGFFDVDDWSYADQCDALDDCPTQTDVEAFMDSPRFPKLTYVDSVGDGYPEAQQRGSDGEWRTVSSCGWGEPRFPLR